MSCYNLNLRFTKEREQALNEAGIEFTRNGDYIKITDHSYDVDDLFDLIEDLGKERATKELTKPETLYIPLKFKLAFQAAMDELAENGIQNTSITSEEVGEYLVVTVEPTAANHLFVLGISYSAFLIDNK